VMFSSEDQTYKLCSSLYVISSILPLLPLF
jgi:hypothetical protein